MATAVNLDFYDGGSDYAVPPPSSSSLPPAPSGLYAPPAIHHPAGSNPYAMPPPAFTAPTTFATPSYAPYAAPSSASALPGFPSSSSLGSMEGAAGGGLSSPSSLGFEDEPPLLEELGINFQHIYDKTVAVLHPAKSIDIHIMDDADLAGPLLFCLLFGSFLLASGKVHFGYIYGMGLLSCAGMYMILNLMSDRALSIVQTASVLGYSLLPMVALSSLSVLLSLMGVVGSIMSLLSICWCTVSAARLFTTALAMHDQWLLVAYPCGLIYGVFALLTVF